MPAVPIIREVPVGAIDGVNEVFETSTDYLAGSLRWFDEGFQQVDADLTEMAGKQFRISPAPSEGTVVVVWYRPI